MPAKNEYKFKSKVLVYPGMGGWRFLVLPKKESALIREKFKGQARGWGSLPVSVSIKNTKWKTSIFPDKKSGMYLLPLKLQIRRAEKIVDDDVVNFEIALG